MTQTSMNNDTERIKKAKQGDEGAFSELLGIHLNSLYAFALRYTGRKDMADDVTQETWIKIWKHLGRFDIQKSFKTWAFTILKNTALDALKKEGRTIPFSQFQIDDGSNSIEDTLEDTEPLPDDLFERADLEKHMTAALRTLPQSQQEVLLMRYKEGLSLQEIADILDSPLNTIKSWDRRGVAAVRKNLTAQTAPK